MSLAEWTASLSLERMTAYGLLIVILFLFARGYVVTRSTADKELASLVDGYRVKDEAHHQVLEAKDQRILLLQAEVEEQSTLIARREDQLGMALDEIGPTLIALADAIQTVTLEVNDAVGTHEPVEK